MTTGKTQTSTAKATVSTKAKADAKTESTSTASATTPVAKKEEAPVQVQSKPKAKGTANSEALAKLIVQRNTIFKTTPKVSLPDALKTEFHEQAYAAVVRGCAENTEGVNAILHVFKSFILEDKETLATFSSEKAMLGLPEGFSLDRARSWASIFSICLMAGKRDQETTKRIRDIQWIALLSNASNKMEKEAFKNLQIVLKNRR